MQTKRFINKWWKKNWWREHVQILSTRASEWKYRAIKTMLLSLSFFPYINLWFTVHRAIIWHTKFTVLHTKDSFTRRSIVSVLISLLSFSHFHFFYFSTFSNVETYIDMRKCYIGGYWISKTVNACNDSIFCGNRFIMYVCYTYNLNFEQTKKIIILAKQ